MDPSYIFKIDLGQDSFITWILYISMLRSHEGIFKFPDISVSSYPVSSSSQSLLSMVYNYSVSHSSLLGKIEGLLHLLSLALKGPSLKGHSLSFN